MAATRSIASGSRRAPAARAARKSPKSRAPRNKRVAAASPACVLHGGWDPASRQFHLWAEVAGKTLRLRKQEHPFQLRRRDLLTLLAEVCPQPWTAPEHYRKRSTAWMILPGDGSRPLPSIELQAELEGDRGVASSWGAWRVDTAESENPINALCALDLTANPRARPVRIGQDLEFWCRLAMRAAMAVRRHEYLPAIFPEQDESEKGRGKAQSKSVKFEAGWEFGQGAEARIVEEYARAMPLVCGTLRSSGPPALEHGPPLPDAAGLLRHFLAVNLQRLVQGTKFTKKAVSQVDCTVVAHSLGPETYRPRSWGADSEVLSQKAWKQWRQWRDRLQRSALGADERVCFRLADPPSKSPEDWRLEWLLGSRRDPSFLVPLAEFWAHGSAERPSPRSIREVLLQLGQAARIYSKIWEGMSSATPAEVLLGRGEALAFLKREAPILHAAGFRVIVPAWWTVTGRRRLRLQLTARSGSSSDAQGAESSGLFGMDSLIEFEARPVLDGKPLTPEEWERLVAAKEGLVRIRGQWMDLQADELALLEEHWDSAGQVQRMTVADALRAEAGGGPGSVEVASEGVLGGMFDALRNSDALSILEQPPSFVGMLREYQVRGLSWLSYLERLGFGACLADDMGLGKTVQVLATILHDKVRDPDAGPTLLVAPTSVLGNWQRECERFTPALSTLIHHGPSRTKGVKPFRASIRGTDIVIASFGVARLDAATLSKVGWHRLVLDEAQNIKNPAAAVTKAVRRFKAGRRIAMTGTPVENRLMDLWSLFSVINPGYLGTVTDFRNNVERPIMRDRDRGATRRLRRMVRPFILRRMKTDRAIIKDLPSKVEQNSYCNLTPEQASLYQAVVRETEKKLEDSEGIGRRGLVLATLMRLKQICNHPAQFLQDGSKFAERRSHKLSRVCEMLDEIDAENESALVFTQFTEIGKSLEALLRGRYGGKVYYLHGGTPRARREHMVEQFQNPDTERAIFVLSLRAGGTGITLTRANHVIHFDRWWNPAVENQATDRAYRIGQTKRVLVHKMVTMGTLEERIDELIESKKKLAEEIVGGGESWLADLDNDAFRSLIALDRGNAVVG